MVISEIKAQSKSSVFDLPPRSVNYHAHPIEKARYVCHTVHMYRNFFFLGVGFIVCVLFEIVFFGVQLYYWNGFGALFAREMGFLELVCIKVLNSQGWCWVLGCLFHVCCWFYLLLGKKRMA